MSGAEGPSAPATALHMTSQQRFDFGDTYIFDVKASQGGKALAVSASNHVIKIYDRSTMQIAGTLGGHKDRITGLVFSPTDENILWTSSLDATVRAWDLRSGKYVMSLSDPRSRDAAGLNCVGLNCNSTAVSAGTEEYQGAEDKESSVLLWDPRSTGDLMNRFCETHNDDVTAVAFHPTKPDELLSGSTDGLVCIYENALIAEEDDAIVGVLNSGSSMSDIGYFGPSSEYVYGMTHTESFLCWRLDTLTPISALDVREHLGPSLAEYIINCQYDNATGRLFMATGTFAGNVCVSNVNLTSLTPVTSMAGGHTETVRTLAWDLESREFFSGGEDSVVCRWGAEPATKSASSTPRTSTTASPTLDGTNKNPY